MIEIRIHEDVFADLGNDVLCAMHTLRMLRETEVPAVGNIALMGVSTGTLQTWVDDSGIDGDEFVFLYDPNGHLPGADCEFRFHEDGLANPFGFNHFVTKMAETVPMRSSLSPHAIDAGALTMMRDETLDGDEFVYQWLPYKPDDEL